MRPLTRILARRFRPCSCSRLSLRLAAAAVQPVGWPAPHRPRGPFRPHPGDALEDRLAAGDLIRLAASDPRQSCHPAARGRPCARWWPQPGRPPRPAALSNAVFAGLAEPGSHSSRSCPGELLLPLPASATVGSAWIGLDRRPAGPAPRYQQRLCHTARPERGKHREQEQPAARGVGQQPGALRLLPRLALRLPPRLALRLALRLPPRPASPAASPCPPPPAPRLPLLVPSGAAALPRPLRLRDRPRRPARARGLGPTLPRRLNSRRAPSLSALRTPPTSARRPRPSSRSVSTTRVPPDRPPASTSN